MSPRLPGDGARAKKNQDAATLFALLIVIAVALGFIALISMVLPQVWYLIVVAGFFSGFIALHYFTWGRWLTKVATEAQKKEEAGNEERS